jgi:hypothetical protein
MIITKLNGGLGNQLFQYACGRALSLRNGDMVKLDITSYAAQANNPGMRAETVRVYSLGHFAVHEQIATDDEIRRLKYPHGIVSKGWRFAKKKFLRQFNIGFHSRIFSKKGDFYLDGYWQTPLYFNDAEKEIRKDLVLKKSFGPAADAIFEKINADAAAVSLHVRRGDYVTNSRISERHGLCSPEYYDRATAEMTKRVGAFNLYIFSDDIAWVRDNMKFPSPATFVSAAGIPDYEELALMGACRHHITANSSFSWWGAWLNPRQDKVVITPRRWVDFGNRKHKDMIPPSWIRL